jgi:hypothetical protein
LDSGYFLNFLLSPTSPSMPDPRRSIVAGSGTALRSEVNVTVTGEVMTVWGRPVSVRLVPPVKNGERVPPSEESLMKWTCPWVSKTVGERSSGVRLIVNVSLICVGGKMGSSSLPLPP